MTYGDLKLRLTKQFPGIDLDLIEGWINDRYAEILSELPWQRLKTTGILKTVAPYSTGTVSVTKGSTGISGTGTIFTPAMTARAFRVATRDEFYEFTYVSATSGTLDRAYEGPDGSLVGYKLFQQVYPMPAACRMLEDDAFETFTQGPLRRFSKAELNRAAPSRWEYGTPEIWASYMDDGSTPPRMQVELYPAPDAAIGIPFTYVSDPGALTSTSTILQVWMEPTALVEGVTGRIKAHLKDYVGAQLAFALAKAALQSMLTTEAQGMAPAQMRMDPYYTSHRMRRCNR